jgi:tRNA threonylcarbamoyladenosine biosynthesis protein TsaB
MILAVDTSTRTLSIAISDTKKILGEVCLDTDLRHSEIFLEQLDLLLKKRKVSLKDLTKIVCSTGPGSFTGIRVGLSACRTLSQILGLPLVGICTLDVLSEGVKNFGGMKAGKKILVCPIIGNQQDEVYTALYELRNQRDLKKITPYVSISIGELTDKLAARCRLSSSPVVFIGDAVALYKDLIKSKLKNKAVFLKDNFSKPKASILAILGQKIKGVNYEKVKPLYVKSPRIYGGK